MRSQFSHGIFICDHCDRPVNTARLICLSPDKEKAAQIKDKSVLRDVLLALCPRCNQHTDLVKALVYKAAKEYNAWVEKQLNK